MKMIEFSNLFSLFSINFSFQYLTYCYFLCVGVLPVGRLVFLSKQFRVVCGGFPPAVFVISDRTKKQLEI